MQSLKCEMCGSNDIIKQDGIYVCQHCGTKYSPEEAKKMFIQGSIIIDNAASAKNYLLLAENASESQNYSDAEKYSNKVIEINPNEASAWFIKGKAAGWQTTLNNLRTNEAVNCFNKALELKEDESFKINIQNELKGILQASVDLALNIYSGYPSAERSYEVINVAKLSRALYFDFCNKHFLDIGDFDEQLMTHLIMSVITTYSAVILGEYIGVEHPSDFEFTDYLTRVDGAIAILDYATALGNNYVALSSAYEIKIQILTDKEASKSYTIGSGGTWVTDKTLNNETKKLVIDEIMETHKKWNSIDPSHKIPRRPSPSSGCYIATAIYGAYDCPEVWVLRRFRDYTLTKTWYGKVFISVYYAISPSFVRWFGTSKPFKAFVKPLLDMMVESLRQKGVEDAPYNDQHW